MMAIRPSEPTPRTLLIVDDSKLILRMVDDFFSTHGYRVVQADDGTTALERIDEAVPDVIVADILMPTMDGWALFEEVRKRPESAEVPFVFLTVERELPKRLRGFQVGADDYVTKPFEVEELHARIDRILERRRALEAARGPGAALLSGSVEHLAMSDLLQILSMNGKDGVVHVREGSESGEIHFAAGAVVHAETGAAVGVKALYRMFAWAKATFRFVPREGPAPARSIEGPTSNVIMDGLVALDEWHRWRERLPERGIELRLASDARSRLKTSHVRPAEYDVLARSKTGETVGGILDRSPLPDGPLAQAICTLVDRGVLVPG